MKTVFLTEISSEEAFPFFELPKYSRVLKGQEISTPSGLQLFQSLKDAPITCYACGVIGTRWIACRGRKENKYTLNLFADLPNGGLVMMTRDHIIPKSFGGSDNVQNLRPACETCNGARGNRISRDDVLFAQNHPHLFNASKFAEALRAANEKQPVEITARRIRRAANQERANALGIPPDSAEYGQFMIGRKIKKLTHKPFRTGVYEEIPVAQRPHTRTGHPAVILRDGSEIEVRSCYVVNP